MLFNSLEFLTFFIIFFLLYWKIIAKHLQAQNWFVLVGSVLFYSWWNWRFLFLLFFTITLDFFVGIKIDKAKQQPHKNRWLWLSILVNLAFLGFFKYYNFFIESFVEVLDKLGFQAHLSTLQIILPVGISFYTFHGLSYVIDIYKGKIKAEKNFVNYAVFVSFFPLLVAGPIERATHLLPQVKQKRIFNYLQATDGLKQILWGLFKKIVIADTCAEQVNYIFSHTQDSSGTTLAIGAVFFAFQIYGDFSGYTDIALGTAKLLGFELLKNFSFPYFSRSIAEFWRRWHISLSSWFKDYLYIPLGGSKNGKIQTIRNTFIIFLVSGFWHGANYTFIAWGFLHALYIMPSVLLNTNRQYVDIVAQGRLLPNAKELFQILITFILVCIAWIFFRAENIGLALEYIQLMCTKPWYLLEIKYIKIVILIVLFILVEWKQREKNIVLNTSIKSRYLRYLMYYFLLITILFFISKNQKTDFIYFAF
jgi:alginate O-acetyltransferase complex protein AlgI